MRDSWRFITRTVYDDEENRDVTFGDWSWVSDHHVFLFRAYNVSSCTVTYNGNGSTGGSVPVDGGSPYVFGSTVTVLDNTGGLVRPGYAFRGWATTQNASVAVYLPGQTFTVVDDVVLYAVWTRVYSVTYHGNGSTGGGVPVDSNLYELDASVSVLGRGTLEKTGGRFVGWAYVSSAVVPDFFVVNNVVVPPSFSITQDVTLFAVWEEASLQTFAVSYDGNGSTGGSAPVDAESPYGFGSSVTVLGNSGGLVRSGFVFLGWSDYAFALVAKYPVGSTFAMPHNDVVLYAVWVPVFTVTYNGNGATSGTVPSDNNSYSSGASVPVQANPGNLARTGRRFLGWAPVNNASTPVYSVSGSTVYPATFNMGTANVDLYAVWVALFTVTYHANGATSGNVPVDSSSPYSSGSVA
ncbi:MAG: InlB B-repeat-containing protein, partial [Candidatus Bathyarchaeota archaeon]|nr:InlB B-repeat-containing protein [Candidatus Termitimicrobium sp.]